ncbi:MAG: NADH-quinone oxidoreductase subunit H [Candidatus Sumerlaeota bacterium]|nr:NADH-quinone oxidoreductase subunit H [Candidatus Sumerlaeota bacterium]
MQEFVHFLQHDVLARISPPLGALPDQIVLLGAILVGAAPIVAFMAVIAMAWTYGERRIAGFIQARYGPNRVGPEGVLQPLADGIKLLAKEDIAPAGADRPLYELAPLLVFVGALLPFVALPFSEKWVISSMAAGVFYVLAFEAIEVIGIIMAGWAPNSKWSLYGGMRLAAQMVAYEIPMGLCLLTVVALAGTLNLGQICQMQGGAFGVGNWMVWPWVSPFATLAFFMFFVGGLAATKRAPFDLPEAESELVAGFHTEYSGIRFAFFFMAEYAAMYVVCAVATVCFLGGWHGPFREWLAPAAGAPTISDLLGKAVQVKTADGAWFVWANLWGALSVLGKWAFWKPMLYELLGAFYLIAKSFFLLFVMVWMRWTLPRIRIDQVIYMCLKVLLPFSLLCVLGAAAQTVFTDWNLLHWLLSAGK